MTEEPDEAADQPPAIVLYVVYALLVAIFFGVLIAVGHFA